MFHEIHACRVCGGTRLDTILDLGRMSLAGHFPKPGERVDESPLELVRCLGECGLVQLRHTYSLSEMYGENYGYRSGLNSSMLAHLKGRLDKLRSQVALATGDVVLDIGSNDSSLLQMYPSSLKRVGIDPTSEKFKSFYPGDVVRVPDFFSEKTFSQAVGPQKAKAITSIAMLYDLERPLDFVADIKKVLAPDGAWLFEQSYLPTMCELTSYDTICQEHLEYYSLAALRWMLNKSGLTITDVELTDANGGSISLIARHTELHAEHPEVAGLIDRERRQLDQEKILERFAARTIEHRKRLKSYVSDLVSGGARVWGLGASTKGNVILQWCGLDAELITGVLEVNADKFGRTTPGTLIPIVDERNTPLGEKDVLLVLPWHFRPFFEKKMAPLVDRGVRMLYPLPQIELVSR